MPFIPEALADVSPILLSHMRVVVLLIRPTPRHEHRSGPLLQPTHHVIIQELSSVIAVQTQQLKGQTGFHITQCLPASRPGLVPRWPATPPKSLHSPLRPPSRQTLRPRSRRIAPPYRLPASQPCPPPTRCHESEFDAAATFRVASMNDPPLQSATAPIIGPA